MHGENRSAQRLATIVLVGWVVAFVGGFAAFFLTPAKDFGLSSGWNKVGAFIGWQAVALTLAVISAMVSRIVPRDQALRRMGLVPLAGSGLLVLAIVALVAWGNMQRTPPDPGPPRATTEPVKPVTQPWWIDRNI